MIKATAEYLPVEGEIKYGDLYIHKYAGVNKWDHANPPSKELGHRLAKPFAVTQELKVGDEVHHIDESTGIIQDTDYNDQPEVDVKWTSKPADKNRASRTSIEYLHKVLGELSPDATWVKEGEEIEVELFAHDKLEEDAEAKLPLGKPLQIHPLSSYPLKERIGTIICKVKCSTCNTYH